MKFLSEIVFEKPQSCKISGSAKIFRYSVFRKTGFFGKNRFFEYRKTFD